MEIMDKRLFLKYSLPCAGTLVKRGWVTQERIDSLAEDVVKGRDITADPKEIFTVAGSMCTLLARKAGKNEISAEIIRKYFQEEHDPVIDSRHKEMGDFDPEACRVYPARVLESKGKLLTVVSPKGRRPARNDYKLKLSKGDYIVTHYDIIIEQISESQAKVLWGSKRIYNKAAFTGFAEAAEL